VREIPVVGGSPKRGPGCYAAHRAHKWSGGPVGGGSTPFGTASDNQTQEKV